VERPRRVVRFARLMHRRVRAFGPAFGRRRLRRHLMPDLVATQGERWPAKLDDVELLAFSRP
jgi:hypothetical protein